MSEDSTVNWLHRYQLLLTAEKRGQQQLSQLQADSPWLQDLGSWECQHSERAKAQKCHMQSIQNIQRAVIELSQELDDLQAGPMYVKRLAELIDNIQSSISKLKQKERTSYAELVCAQHELESSLVQTVDGIAAWALEEPQVQPAALQQPRDAPGKQCLPQRVVGAVGCDQHSTGALVREVELFNRYVEEHGPTGGWLAEDHQHFLSILRASKGDYSQAVLVSEERLPSLSRSQVIAHARWHADYLDLDMQRRVALVNWRQRRDEQRRLQHAHQDVLETGPAAPQSQEDVSKDQGEAVLRQLQRSKLEAWRAQRAAEAQRKVAQEAQRRAAVAAEADRRRQAQQAANRQKLQGYRQQQREVPQHSGVALEPSSCNQADTAALERVRLRNEVCMTRRAALVAAKEQRMQQRQLAQQQLRGAVQAPAVVRDPARLVAATAATKARLDAAKAEELQPRDSGFILQVGHRTIPSWLK